MSGPVAILGCPGAGKTTFGRELAARQVAETGAPLLVVDTAHQEVFDDMPHAETLEQAIEGVWGAGQHVAYTPKDPDDFEDLCGAVYAARGIIFFVDELKNVIPPGHPMRANFRRCLSEWRRVLVGCYVTSQLYTDAGRSLKGLASEWYFFRMIGGDDQRDIRTDHKIEPEVLAALPSARQCYEQRLSPEKAYIHLRVGF